MPRLHAFLAAFGTETFGEFGRYGEMPAIRGDTPRPVAGATDRARPAYLTSADVEADFDFVNARFTVRGGF